MFDLIQRVASQSIDPTLFIAGMGVIYLTSLILLVAAAFKFLEHAASTRKVARKITHPFSSREMIFCMAALFPFWLRSIGQIKMSAALQSIYFGVGFILILCAVAWHIWAKVNIRAMWSDAIEIKQDHILISTGAYALSRHPMYASLLLWCWSASLMMFNWITMTIATLVILPLMIARARAEERELAKVLPGYLSYQESTRMLAPTIRGYYSLAVRIAAMCLLGYYIWEGLTLPSMILLLAIHTYLGYCLTPEKVAFSYRSKSGLMLVIWGLSQIWHPVYYLLYAILAMFIYGLKFNCPCMLIYNKYHGCPCISLAAKCFIKKPLAG
ncbi:MAG TPA: isoprenylcysteine carboxylmethyltransferase family protein [Terracidiphilus sp.]|nr:isoprenylcysteine carboxylmethyltransferase family protein [Terracidiphilus sp.]